MSDGSVLHLKIDLSVNCLVKFANFSTYL